MKRGSVWKTGDESVIVSPEYITRKTRDVIYIFACVRFVSLPVKISAFWNEGVGVISFGTYKQKYHVIFQEKQKKRFVFHVRYVCKKNKLHTHGIRSQFLRNINKIPRWTPIKVVEPVLSSSQDGNIYIAQRRSPTGLTLPVGRTLLKHTPNWSSA